MKGSKKHSQQDDPIKDYFVAFIDILGFSQMIENDKGSGQQLKIIKNAINQATSFIKTRKKDPNHPYAYWYKEFQIKSFSDCFCFSIPLEFKNGDKDYMQNFVSFYVWLEVFCNTLLKNGFLCRGGITQGWHYFDKEIIFSKALIDAYQLESKHANDPMVMVHPNLINKLSENNFSDQKCYKYVFVHDQAGRTFLNPFNYSIVDEIFFNPAITSLTKFFTERTDLINLFLPIIDVNISNLTGSPAVEKWQWLKDFANYTLDHKHVAPFDTGFFNRHLERPNLN